MKFVAALLASAALAWSIPAMAAAPQRADTVDASLPTQLPRTAIPHHYAIAVTPHAERLTFDGDVAIDLEVIKPTGELVLNAADLQLASATLRPQKGSAALPATISLDPKSETATLSFSRSIAPGAYRLAIRYSGEIHTQANGLFALDYKNPAGAQRRAIFTQFEPADARRFFPGWDEPDYKATFDLTARVPAGEMAVSNMPATSSREIGGGLKEVRFQPTPVMSSYLLFFGSGDFGRITKMAGKTEVGIVMGRGNEAKARTALDAEAQILPYYNDYFGTPYPLPKLDNVAGPGQSQFFSAMENWGAIFTFERVLLDDPAVTTESERQAIFGVEAHEMAHQWFGDLVTMAWWDDLWLNEGFASWMASKATKHFHPDWGEEFAAVGSREGAMGQDALSTTHPIVQKVRTVEQANQAFDSITYSKGESILNMLEGYAGADVWQRGIQAYIRAHAYRNTRTDDLWRAVEAAGAKGLTQIAHDFTLQPGVPLIRVGPVSCTAGQSRVVLTQDEFSSDRKPGSFAPLTWHVPVKLSVVGGQPVTALTSGRETQVTVPGCGPLLANVGQTGYYRTLYQPAAAEQLRANFGRIDPLDEYGLVHDQLELSEAGYQPMAVGLGLVAAIPASARAELLSLGNSYWAGLYRQFDDDAATQRLIAALIEQRYAPVLTKIGLHAAPNELPTVTTFRPELIQSLGEIGEPRVNTEAHRLFAAMQSNPDAVSGGLKQTWLSIIAANADGATWEQLHAMARNASSATERQNLYSLLGRTKDEALAKRALELSLTDEPGTTVSAGMIRAVASRHPDLALDFVLSRWSEVEKFVDLSAKSRFIGRIASGSHDAATIGKLEAYANGVSPTDRKPIDQAINVIRVRLGNEARIKSEVATWLRSNANASPPASAPPPSRTERG